MELDTKCYGGRGGQRTIYVVDIGALEGYVPEEVTLISILKDTQNLSGWRGQKERKQQLIVPEMAGHVGWLEHFGAGQASGQGHERVKTWVEASYTWAGQGVYTFIR